MTLDLLGVPRIAYNTIQLGFGSLERMLMGYDPLDNSLLAIKRSLLDDYYDQGGSRDAKGAKGRQTGLEGP